MHYLYILSDPRTSKIRYVGQCIDPKERLKGHCKTQHKNNHYSYWINKLRSLGLKPIMEVIETCDESNWAERETYWIKWYREQGCDLVNATDGGEGSTGWKHTEETRRKLSESHKGKTFSETHKINIGKSKAGKTRSEETKKRISKARKGKPLSEETKERISKAHRGERSLNWGKSFSEDTKRKMSEASRGENNANSKLTKHEIKEIRNSLLPRKELAGIYKVSLNTISKIKLRKSWKDVE